MKTVGFAIFMIITAFLGCKGKYIEIDHKRMDSAHNRERKHNEGLDVKVGHNSGSAPEEFHGSQPELHDRFQGYASRETEENAAYALFNFLRQFYRNHAIVEDQRSQMEEQQRRARLRASTELGRHDEDHDNHDDHENEEDDSHKHESHDRNEGHHQSNDKKNHGGGIPYDQHKNVSPRFTTIGSDADNTQSPDVPTTPDFAESTHENYETTTGLFIGKENISISNVSVTIIRGLPSNETNNTLDASQTKP